MPVTTSTGASTISMPRTYTPGCFGKPTGQFFNKTAFSFVPEDKGGNRTRVSLTVFAGYQSQKLFAVKALFGVHQGNTPPPRSLEVQEKDHPAGHRAVRHRGRRGLRPADVLRWGHHHHRGAPAVESHGGHVPRPGDQQGSVCLSLCVCVVF